MARSSSSCASTGAQGEGSPIPYRQGPLEYSPPRICYCGTKAARWISWSDLNPGRCYFTCYRRRSGGCDYWFWAEDPHPDFIQNLLRDLKNAIGGLKRQNRELMDRLGDAAVVVEEQKEQVRALRTQMVANANSKEKEADAMRVSVCRMEKELVVYKFVMKCCVVLVVLAVWNKWWFT